MLFSAVQGLMSTALTQGVRHAGAVEVFAEAIGDPSKNTAKRSVPQSSSRERSRMMDACCAGATHAMGA